MLLLAHEALIQFLLLSYYVAIYETIRRLVWDVPWDLPCMGDIPFYGTFDVVRPTGRNTSHGIYPMGRLV